MDFLWGKKTSEIKKEEYEPPSYAKFYRDIVDIYPRGQITHHVFGSCNTCEKRFSPVMYYVESIYSVNNDGNFTISFKKLDRLGSPLLAISKVYLQHKGDIKKIIYKSIPISPFLHQKRETDEIDTYITEISIIGFPHCWRGDTSNVIDVNIELYDETHVSSMKLIVEYVQSAGYEDSILGKLNYTPAYMGKLISAKEMVKVDDFTYRVILNPCKVRGDDEKTTNTYITSVIVAKKQLANIKTITCYARPINADEKSIIRPINEISGIFAAEKFRQDNIPVIQQKGYKGYTLPFTPSKTSEHDCTHHTINTIPEGAINLDTVKKEGNEFVIDVKFTDVVDDNDTVYAVIKYSAVVGIYI